MPLGKVYQRSRTPCPANRVQEMGDNPLVCIRGTLGYCLRIWTYTKPMTDREKIAHLLRRFGLGAGHYELQR